MIKRIQSDYESLFFCDFVSEKEALGLSKQTIDNYKQVYDLFVRQMGQKISKDSVSKWVHTMIDGDMNPITINYYIGQLKVFAYWLMDKNYLKRFEIKKLKVQEPQIKTLNDEEVYKLLEQPAISSAFTWFRSWVIINFILGTGARASTVMKLKVEDIDFINKDIKFRHLKNKSSAIVPLSSSLEKILKQYMGIWDLGNGFLFPDKFGGQLTISALEQSLRRFSKSRGVKYRGAHAFRHTFAKKYILNGGNAFALQRLLTHTDLSMTKKYVHLFSSDLKNGYEK